MKTTWIFAVGMRRAGSTLQYHLANELVQHASGYGNGWTPWQDFEGVFAEHDGNHPFAMVKCHAKQIYSPAINVSSDGF